MCLRLEIELPADTAGRIGARRLARETGLHVTGYYTKDGRRRFHFARGRGCSCSLLAANFEIEKCTWLLEPSAGPALAQVVALVADTVPTFTFHSEWEGVERESEPVRTTTTAAALITELENNCLLADAVREVKT
jgi:hypothetical protein